MKHGFLIATALLLFMTFLLNAQEKPRLAVFVVGKVMDNEVGDMLATLIGNDLGGGDKYEIITRTDAVQKKLKQLRDYEKSGNVNERELIEWGQQNSVSMLCMITAIKLDGYMFAAQLTDVRSNRLKGSGDYISSSLGVVDLRKVAAALAIQLQGNGGNSSSINMSMTSGNRSGQVWNPDGIEMIYVEGGTFTMGATDEQGNDAETNEKPAHSVTLSSFYIGKYEVTQAQWKAVMGNNPFKYQGDNRPAEQISWNDVQEFIRKLNAKTGKSYRLPTEAEWEYAARGGRDSRGYKYSGSNNINDVAWYGSNSGNTTHPVGSKQPNELGIYDMSGNVWEWCQDWYDSYSSNSQTNHQGPSSGSYRVDRGGSWYIYAEYCRVSRRNSDSPGFSRNNLGFRLACSSR